MALTTVEELTGKFDKLYQAGWRVEIHVIGDRAVDIALKAMEKSQGNFKMHFRAHKYLYMGCWL